MFIRCGDGRILNSRYCRSFSTGQAQSVREVRHGNGGTVYSSLPSEGWLLLGWMNTPVCIGCYETRAQAEHSLQLLFAAMTESRPTFTAPR